MQNSLVTAILSSGTTDTGARRAAILQIALENEAQRSCGCGVCERGLTESLWEASHGLVNLLLRRRWQARSAPLPVRALERRDRRGRRLRWLMQGLRRGPLSLEHDHPRLERFEATRLGR